MLCLYSITVLLSVLDYYSISFSYWIFSPVWQHLKESCTMELETILLTPSVVGS